VIVLLLVSKNECSLLRANISHHLEWGIDHLCVADNMSTDGTAEMLRDFGDAVSTIRFRHFPHRQAVRVEMLDRVRARYGEPDWVGVSDSDEFWWTSAASSMAEVLEDTPAEIIGVNFDQKLFLPTQLDRSDLPVVAQREYRTAGSDSPLHTSYSMGKTWYRGSWVHHISHEHWCPEVDHPRFRHAEPMVHHYMIQSEEQFVQKVLRLRSWQPVRRQRIERVLDVVRRPLRRPSPPPVRREFKLLWWTLYQEGGQDALREFYRNTYTLSAEAVHEHLASGALLHDPAFALHARDSGP
jgi:hypothetical protein